MGLRDRIQPALYDFVGSRMEKKAGAADYRRRLLASARGRVLEIGAGTGFNLAHYPSEVEELVLTDPNAGMLRRAEKHAREQGRRVVAVRASADALPFPDASFDTVVSTLVLCTVPDPEKALAEVRRVLRPDGRLLFLEHVRSSDPKRARWQDRLEGVWGVLADGCHPNRDTLARIEVAPFTVEEVEHGEIPKMPRLVREFILGRAVAR